MLKGREGKNRRAKGAPAKLIGPYRAASIARLPLRPLRNLCVLCVESSSDHPSVYGRRQSSAVAADPTPEITGGTAGLPRISCNRPVTPGPDKGREVQE